ncbi:hypothetical protein EQV77_07690 [Halobacillus fulvus]|nr:hypothetical protein EQV77_07690 [Halobacillus fulvus]
MKKWRWFASIALSATIAFFMIASFIYTPEDSREPSPPAETTEVENTAPDQSPEAPGPVEEPDEDPEEDEASIREELRDVFTSVLESAREMFIRDDYHISAIGDSLTQGVGDRTDNGGYVGILEESLNSQEDQGTVVIDNFGKRGNRTDQLLERMETEEMKSSIEEADIVLVTIGANDVMKVVRSNFTSLNYEDFVEAQQGYEERLDEILSTIEELNSDATIYLIGLYNPFNSYFNNIPELNQIMGDWNRISKEVIDRHERTTFIPIRDIFENSEENLLWEEDFFHPNEQGYKLMAERVLEYIRDDLEQ